MQLAKRKMSWGGGTFLAGGRGVPYDFALYVRRSCRRALDPFDADVVRDCLRMVVCVCVLCVVSVCSFVVLWVYIYVCLYNVILNRRTFSSKVDLPSTIFP